MRKRLVASGIVAQFCTTTVLLLLLSAGFATAQPEYSDDPFGDGDFQDLPKVINVAYPTDGRLEVGLLFTTSMTDKYLSHIGSLVDVTYYLSEAWGVGVSMGFFHGSLTSIVTDDAGILGNNVLDCVQNQRGCDDINPNVPDYRQVTGFADAVVTWAPLYGKVNLVSEVDANIQLYLLAGAGVNGTRRINAVLRDNPTAASDFRLQGKRFGKGGFFEDLKFNVTGGVGVRIFLVPGLALRTEVRGLWFRDTFDFGDGPSDYFTSLLLGQAGVSVMF